MAERPIFIPAPESLELVKQLPMQLKWHPGFAPSQKKKNIIALHESAARAGYAPLLEVSTKSDEQVGQRLSAFSLMVNTETSGKLPLESAFQGSKVFERGGPFTDLYRAAPRDARRDPRLKESGGLTGFKFENISFPLEPKTVFYDWLYIKALYEHREWLRRHIFQYAGFTDIEFNPERSINCQARSCALLVALIRSGLLDDDAVASPGAFIRVLSACDYRPDHANLAAQEAMFHR
jgi:hypothetical protein